MLIKRFAVVLSGPHGGGGPPFTGESRSLSERNGNGFNSFLNLKGISLSKKQ